jgi:hypothetical protein
MHRSRVVHSLLVALGAAMIVAVSTGGAAAAGTGEGTKIDWTKEPVEGARLVPGTAPGGGPALRVDSSRSGIAVRLATIDRPPVEPEGYVVTGQVRYQGVQGRGYLEMWSVFADGSRYFSRTLAATGPLALAFGHLGVAFFRSSLLPRRSPTPLQPRDQPRSAGRRDRLAGVDEAERPGRRTAVTTWMVE